MASSLDPLLSVDEDLKPAEVEWRRLRSRAALGHLKAVITPCSAARSSVPAAPRAVPRLTLIQVTLSRVMNLLSAVAAAAGIILLVIGYLIDQDFFCGYAGEVSECQAVTNLFIVSVLHF